MSLIEDHKDVTTGILKVQICMLIHRTYICPIAYPKLTHIIPNLFSFQVLHGAKWAVSVRSFLVAKIVLCSCIQWKIISNPNMDFGKWG